MARFLLLALAFLCSPTLTAQTRLDLEAGPVALTVAPTEKVGTHENTFGLYLGAAGRLPLGAREHAVLIRSGLEVEALVEDLGIRGPSAGAQVDLEVGYAFGPASMDGAGRSARTHEIAYSLIAYLDSDDTSQLSGSVRYTHSRLTWSLGVQFENDALAQQLLDRYRTFALRVQYLRRDTATPVGIGLRTIVWTGTTEGLGRLGREDVYDLSGQYGGNTAHGILALDVYHGDLTLSVGLDSEAIRSTLQNSFHYLIDDGQIPRLDLPPRLFVRLALNEIGGLY